MVPPKSKFVSYYRVSTQKQGRSGLGLEAQKTAVEHYLRQHTGVELASFTEIESGKNAIDRPKLQSALLRCRQAKATLLVAKLDRLSRNASFLMSLRDSGVQFEALDVPGANMITVGVMALMAQQERELISARTKAALAARKARGLPLGNPDNLKYLKPHAAAASRLGQAANRRKAIVRAKEIAPLIADARKAGNFSLRKIADYLNEGGNPTPRGKQWTATAVAHAITYSQYLADD
jgi:DNA invertase Pin-like site-specific DNA recombinase